MAPQARVDAERMRTDQPGWSHIRRILRPAINSRFSAAVERSAGASGPRLSRDSVQRQTDRSVQRFDGGEQAAQPDDLLAAPVDRIAALVVDDLPIYRHAIRRILQPLAGRIFVADDGLEALEQLRRSRAANTPIDIVLTDMHMPVMDGLELISRMRLAGDLTPVVVMTTDPSDELRLTIERFPRTAVALKPIDAGKLMQMILEVQQMGPGRRS